MAGAAALGVALALLYPDGYQQDAGQHFIFARWAWGHPDLFVGVWSRPLFTFLYSFPAALGYPVAKLFTLAICLVTAHQTYRLARQLRVDRAPLVMALLFLQPAYFLSSTETMTEPIFALVFVLALRAHTAGRTSLGMLLASLMALARPEGFFLGLLWGVWVLVDERDPRAWWSRLPSTVLLATGTAIWVVAAWWITGDILFIKHNWPANWEMTAKWYGVGAPWEYVIRLPEIAGPLLSVLLVIGLWRLVRARQLGTITSSFLFLLVVHSVLRTFGLFGSAGYARYFVCVAPATAIATLAGWNVAAGWFARSGRRWQTAAATATLAISTIACVLYIDLYAVYGRDARAVREMHDWFTAHPRPVSRVIWSQAYMAILFDSDPWDKPAFGTDKAMNIEMLRAQPSGTIVFWDGDTGPAWWGLTADDFETAGFVRLRSQTHELDGWLQESRWIPRIKPRKLEMHLLYK